MVRDGEINACHQNRMAIALQVKSQIERLL